MRKQITVLGVEHVVPSYKISAVFFLASLTGCAAIVVNPEARHVIVSPNAAPKGCQYVDQVIGNQGNFFVGNYTSNAHLEEGAMNDLRNKAYAAGANYVQLVTTRAGITGAMQATYDRGGFMSGSSSQTNVTNVGNAYKCPPKLIGLSDNMN
ncbi:MAG: DUF4156 domain-containing protein [Legionellales bacterium]|nr:DUF4156 domain-containing protein [Legionellales bacterium]